MNLPRCRNLTSFQAAVHLGISVKALRLYERHGLIAPDRSPAGWRLYGATDLDRAETIVALRRLGFSLAQVARTIGGDPITWEAEFVAHEERLRSQSQHIDAALAGRKSCGTASNAVLRRRPLN